MFKAMAKRIFLLLPFKVRDSIMYFNVFGRLPNIKKPSTFNEKILFRKHNSCIYDDIYPVLADKYLVRGYVKGKIGENYLIPLFLATTDINNLKKWMSGKSGFVVKPNHGAGMVRLVDASPTDEEINSIGNSARKWLDTDFSLQHAEPHYSRIKRLIIVEEKLGVSNLLDYKIHLFRNENGGFFYILQVIEDRFTGELNRTFYLNNLDDLFSGEYTFQSNERSNLELAIELSKKLIGDIEYARIDWYISDNKLYFGEITLTPAAGVGAGYGDELDRLMGSKWNLSLSPRNRF